MPAFRSGDNHGAFLFQPKGSERFGLGLSDCCLLYLLPFAIETIELGRNPCSLARIFFEEKAHPEYRASPNPAAGVDARPQRNPRCQGSGGPFRRATSIKAVGPGCSRRRSAIRPLATNARLRPCSGTTSATGYAGCCEALAAWDASAHLGRIRAPTLVLSGSEDSVAPPDQGRAIAEGIVGARFAVLEDAAHLASAGQPAAFTRAVLDHLTEEEP